MLKSEIRILAKKMIARMEALYPDGAIVFLSYWNRPGDEDTYSVMQGDEAVVERCFREMEQKIRQMESCNLNPSEESCAALGRLIDELEEEGDVELIDLFQKISNLLAVDGEAAQESPYFGEAIVMVGWMELGIQFHKYVEFVGMARGVIGLFNAGVDSFRRLYSKEEEQL